MSCSYPIVFVTHLCNPWNVCMYVFKYVCMRSMQRSSGLCAKIQPLFRSQNHSKPSYSWSIAGPSGCMACSQKSDGQQHEPRWKSSTCVAALYSKHKHTHVFTVIFVFYFGWVTNGISDKKTSEAERSGFL